MENLEHTTITETDEAKSLYDTRMLAAKICAVGTGIYYGITANGFIQASKPEDYICAGVVALIGTIPFVFGAGIVKTAEKEYNTRS